MPVAGSDKILRRENYQDRREKGKESKKGSVFDYSERRLHVCASEKRIQSFISNGKKKSWKQSHGGIEIVRREFAES